MIRKIGIVTIMALAGCVSMEEPSGPVAVAPSRIPGMTLVKAKGETVSLGSTGSLAGPDESPVIMNEFRYDFQMDTTEVSQAEFLRLMGRNPVPARGPKGASGAHPVSDVSWFDAVLYCNARSREAGLDTVYAYSQKELSVGGTVYGLADLAVRLEQRGFRLPTEAEWEFAAKAGSGGEFPWGGLGDSSQAASYAWHAGNSGGTTHPVGELRPNAFGLYDMAGNVMEWINDWKAAYPGRGVTDFAGAVEPGPESDAPVKGGAFKYGLKELRPSNRSATYASIRSATAEYVGFRCVMGPISNPSYSTGDGAVSQARPVEPSLIRLQSLIGGRRAKLVFVNTASGGRRQLAYIDFGKYPPRVRQFGSDGNVFHPSISPDGRWAAFGTGPEGAASGSSLHIRGLDGPSEASLRIGAGFIPRWWVDRAARDTFLLYASSAMDNSFAPWTGGQTLMQKISGGIPQGEPTLLTAEGGFHDGRSVDGRFLATGFRLLKLRDLATSETRILFTAPENGKAARDTSQVCNVSIAPDSSGRMLFLDFGYDGISGLTGGRYGIHQSAFMADPMGRVLKWFKAPQAVKAWEGLEWSNHTDFAVSASTDASGSHRDLYLIDLKDSLYTRLASGGELEHPALWLGEAPDSIATDGLSLDSLGHYDDPATDISQSVFSNRMTKFWKRHNELEMIFTGSSHVFSGIDPRRITRYQALNMGFPANGWGGQEGFLRDYALNHCPKLKVMVMQAFPGWLHYQGGDPFDSWATRIAKTKGVAYDSSNGFWKTGLPFRFGDLVQSAPNSDKADSDSAGFLHFDSGAWGAPVPPTESDWGLDHPVYLENMRKIEAIAALLAERKIHLVLVIYPTNPAFKGNAYYGPYGPRTEVAAAINARFRAMETISPYVHFYDAHADNDHDYGDGEAINTGHLSSSGAAKLTSRIDSLVNAFR